MLEDWSAGQKVARLWDGDASLWTGRDESRWLGWLDVAGEQLRHIDELRTLAERTRADGLGQALLVGMGGSSLAPEVLAETFGSANGAASLRVLDSTDPAEVRAAEASIDLTQTLFFVSSKSGTTLEPDVLKKYFFAKVRDAVGSEAAGSRFVAITDPGSSLEREARGGRLPCCPARPRVDRRPVLGAVELRDGARRGRGRGHRRDARARGTHGRQVRPGRPAAEEPGTAARSGRSVRAAARDATS